MGQSNSRPISKHAQRQIRRDEELQIHLTVQRMENFIMLAYMVGNKKHSIALILGSAQARSRFSEFVMQDRCSYDLYVLCEIIKIQDIPYMNLFKRAKEIYDTHLKPMNDKRKFVPVAFLTRERVAAALAATNLNDLRAAFNQAIDDIVGGLSASVWIRYVQSKTYSNWRCQERAHACSLTHDDLESFSVVVPPDELVIMSSCETVRRVHSISTEGGKAISMENNIGATSPGKALSVKSSTNGNSKRVIPQATTQWKSSNKSIGASKKSGIFESKTSSIFHLFTKKDSNVYYRPNVLRYDPSVPRSKKPLESLMQKKRLFPAAAALEDCNSCRADFAYLALSSVSSLELLNLINSGSQWLVMFLAGIEGVPLCVSMHSAEYYRGSNVVFPYIYANKYHESVFNVDRNHLVGESLDILFDRADAEQIVAGEDEQQAAKLRTTSAASMPDIYMGLVRGMPSIFCRMVNPLLESGGNMLSVLGSDPQNETFDNATLSAPPVGADTMHVMGGDDSSLRSSSKYSGLVIGVKPIFAGDKNTIIGVITIQQKINAKEKWLQGYKYIEDMLALIPEECDIREYEGSYNFSSYVTGGMKDSSSSPVSKKGSDAYKL